MDYGEAASWGASAARGAREELVSGGVPAARGYSTVQYCTVLD